MTLSTLPEMIGWLLAGGALAWVYLLLISRSVAAIAQPTGSGPAVAYLLARAVLAIAGFSFAAWHGAWPLLLMFAGFLLARTFGARYVGRFEHGS
jgi:hypothetical protein